MTLRHFLKMKCLLHSKSLVFCCRCIIWCPSLLLSKELWPLDGISHLNVNISCNLA